MLRTGGRRPALLIGALTLVKSEGTILAVLACAAILLFWLLESPRRLPARIRGEAGGIGVVAGFLALRLAFVRWVGAPDPVYTGLDGAHLLEALRRIPQVARLCLHELADFTRWGLLWPAFLAAALVLLARAGARERSLAIGTAVAAAVLATPFLFSSWPLELHVSQAYFRLLAQIAPAAVTTVVLGYARAVADGRGPTLPSDPASPAA